MAAIRYPIDEAFKMFPAYAYCVTCGGRYGFEIPPASEHVCPGGEDDDPQWCGWCGAELNDNGSCDNDHEED
jgi:hypothetical protein